MGEHTDTFTESFGKEEGRRKRLLPASCKGERERESSVREENDDEEERSRAAETLFKVGRQ
jgi:hypothetical protein